MCVRTCVPSSSIEVACVCVGGASVIHIKNVFVSMYACKCTLQIIICRSYMNYIVHGNLENSLGCCVKMSCGCTSLLAPAWLLLAFGCNCGDKKVRRKGRSQPLSEVGQGWHSCTCKGGQRNWSPECLGPHGQPVNKKGKGVRPTHQGKARVT